MRKIFAENNCGEVLKRLSGHDQCNQQFAKSARAKIPADAPQGVCPACLLETGLGLLEDEDHDAG